METVTCVDGGLYPSLTEGKEYPVVAWDEQKTRIQVRDDGGTVRWVPRCIFDVSRTNAPILIKATPQDDLEEYVDPSSFVIDIALSDGTIGWCFFTTPAALSELVETTVGDGDLHMYGAPNMIVVSDITQGIIDDTLAYLNTNGLLSSCILPPS